MKFIKHVNGIFCPKDYAINHFLRNINSADLMNIHGVSYHNKTFANPIKKPVAKKSWDICSSACTYNHFGVFFLITICALLQKAHGLYFANMSSGIWLVTSFEFCICPYSYALRFLFLKCALYSNVL